MKAIVVDEPGGPEAMRVADVAEPQPADGEVVVEVAAAGVNRADLLQRQGFYPSPPGASGILGLEVSGTVDGAPVCALLAGGGYAARVAVPAGQVMPVPPGVDLVEAAGVPEVACTVYSNLAMTAHLQPGQWLLVHGGGSGIGTFAIQWARAIGAHVAVTAGSEDKLRRCAELGAEVLINYREQDFVGALPHKADVILDVVGAKYLDRNVRALADGGQLVVIGLQGGVTAELNLNRLLSTRGSIHATSLRSRPVHDKAAICDAVMRDVWPLYASGAIRPVIDRVLPLERAPEAHRVLAESSHVGKVLLTTGWGAAGRGAAGRGAAGRGARGGGAVPKAASDALESVPIDDEPTGSGIVHGLSRRRLAGTPGQHPGPTQHRALQTRSAVQLTRRSPGVTGAPIMSNRVRRYGVVGIADEVGRAAHGRVARGCPRGRRSAAAGRSASHLLGESSVPAPASPCGCRRRLPPSRAASSRIASRPGA